MNIANRRADIEKLASNMLQDCFGEYCHEKYGAEWRLVLSRVVSRGLKGPYSQKYKMGQQIIDEKGLDNIEATDFDITFLYTLMRFNDEFKLNNPKAMHDLSNFSRDRNDSAHGNRNENNMDLLMWCFANLYHLKQFTADIYDSNNFTYIYRKVFLKKYSDLINDLLSLLQDDLREMFAIDEEDLEIKKDVEYLMSDPRNFEICDKYDRPVRRDNDAYRRKFKFDKACLDAGEKSHQCMWYTIATGYLNGTEFGIKKDYRLAAHYYSIAWKGKTDNKHHRDYDYFRYEDALNYVNLIMNGFDEERSSDNYKDVLDFAQKEIKQISQYYECDMWLERLTGADGYIRYVLKYDEEKRKIIRDLLSEKEKIIKAKRAEISKLINNSDGTRRSEIKIANEKEEFTKIYNMTWQEFATMQKNNQ